MQLYETIFNKININLLSFSNVNCHIFNCGFTANCDTCMTFLLTIEKKCSPLPEQPRQHLLKLGYDPQLPLNPLLILVRFGEI
jgi:hypothetical protein